MQTSLSKCFYDLFKNYLHQNDLDQFCIYENYVQFAHLDQIRSLMK